MVHRPNIDPNLAFVLMPFKSPFDSYYDEIIRPAAKSVGLEVRKADEIYGTGPIIHDIWKQIWAATVVIADVTGKNANVNYELGMCHTLNIPTVIITQSFDDVPFDYQHRRCIQYDTTKVDWQRKLRKSIAATLKQVLAGEDVFPELGWPYETVPSRREQGTGSLVPATDARDRVIRGAQMVRDAVAYAFGPRGAHVSVNVGEGQQRYYKKGTDIAGAIHSSERLEEIGIDHAKTLASEMLSRVGDGSKTAVLIFQKMLDLGSLALKRNHSPGEVLRGMDRATEAVVASIRGQSKTANKDSLLQIARTAAGGNVTIARLIVDAFTKAGPDGVVVIEQSNSPETTLDVQEGMNFDRGYIDAAFLASTETQECVLEDAYILVHELKISSMKDLLPLLAEVAVTKKALLVIADDVEGEALATLIVNRKRGTLNCLAVKAPGYSDRRKALLQDIAVVTGANAITLGSGRSLASVTVKDLGRARKVIVTKEDTSILGGAGESNVGEHVQAIREQLSRSVNSFDTEKLRERLAKLSGAIAAVRIGGISPHDRIDWSYSAESAMYSFQNAIEEGTVVGGGLSLLRATEALKRLSFKKPGEVAGVNVIADALEEPLRQLLLNSKMVPADLLHKIKRSKTSGIGFNAETGEVEDLSAVGILDPLTIVTHSVQLAYSHARTLLATAAWDSTPSAQKQSLRVLAEQQAKPSEPKPPVPADH
jgi:chaperonin GroEL